MRDEGEQVRYMNDLLPLFEEEGIDTAFWFGFAGFGLPHRADPRRDLDLGSYGIVRMLDGTGPDTRPPGHAPGGAGSRRRRSIPSRSTTGAAPGVRAQGATHPGPEGAERDRAGPVRGRRPHGGPPRTPGHLKERSRRLLVTTKTEEKAIAAPAIIGFSSPAAASGRAATL